MRRKPLHTHTDEPKGEKKSRQEASLEAAELRLAAGHSLMLAQQEKWS